MSAPPLKRPVFNCQKKRRFSDEFAARAAAQERLQQIEGTDQALPVMRVYRCPECSGWHLTSKPGPRYWLVTADEVYPALTERAALKAFT